MSDELHAEAGSSLGEKPYVWHGSDRLRTWTAQDRLGIYTHVRLRKKTASRPHGNDVYGNNTTKRADEYTSTGQHQQPKHYAKQYDPSEGTGFRLGAAGAWTWTNGAALSHAGCLAALCPPLTTASLAEAHSHRFLGLKVPCLWTDCRHSRLVWSLGPRRRLKRRSVDEQSPAMADEAWVAAWVSGDVPGRCRITKLPLEVLIRITKWLATTDLCALRLTCRAIEDLLYVTFTDEFFTKKQFMITYDSLQALIDISKSRLGAHLRFLHIGLDRFPEGFEGLYRPLPDDEKERKFKQRYSNCIALWNMGYHHEMLTDAFRNLRGLEDVVLRDSNSSKRSRDGPNTEWTSYGSTTIFKETGVRLSQSMDGSCSQVFALVLRALGVARANPKGIEVMVRNGNHLRDFCFDIPCFAEPSVLPVLQKLEKLHLSIDLSWRTSPRGRSADAGPTSQSAPDARLRKFLASIPNLKNLRINEHHDDNSALTDFFVWLAAAPPSGDAPPEANGHGEASMAPVAMPRLEELSLGIMNLDCATLLGAIRKFAPSLRGLELWKVTLQRNLPTGSDPNEPPRNIFWTDFLNQLRQIPDLNLRHFKAGMLSQEYTRLSRVYHVSFKGRGATVDYTGAHWRDFVEEVIPKLEIKWPRTVTPEHGDSDDQVESDDNA
ncbi:Uncharacterized protein TCAP_00028 [Tolypocladium capitatum]|uniref:F-box domain-containing protein n=1 Tax=Tolypocladium capitatum TaxID=45235 RepID=A0A2K3QRA5_9HYPO|nr:Uncharacterized protein TCAP_00028 [Tolypocladium capitatum]